MSQNNEEEEEIGKDIYVPEMELYDFIDTLSTIECFACKYAGNVKEDLSEAMEYFYKEGWRLFEEQVYCKQCLRRIKKENKNKK